MRFEEKPENIKYDYLGLSSYDFYWYSYDLDDKKYSYNDNVLSET